MKDTPLTEVPSDFIDEMCEDEDDSTYETPTTIISTTPKRTTTTDFIPAPQTSTVVTVSDGSFHHTDDPLVTDISTLSGEDTSSVIPIIPPQSTSESIDTTSETTTSFITSSTTKTSFPIIPGSTDEATEVNTLISESTTEAKEARVSLSSTDTTIVTTELSSMSFPKNEATEKTEINGTIEDTTLSMPSLTTERETEITAVSAISTDATSESKITEFNTTTELINLSVSEHTTTEDVRTSAPNTSELIMLSTTEKVRELTIPTTTEITTSITKVTSTSPPDTDKTEEAIIFMTTARSTITSTDIKASTISTSKTDINREETSKFNTVGSTQTDFISTDVLNYTEHTKTIATTSLPTKKIPDSNLIRIIDYSISDDKICITWDIKWQILNEQWIFNDLKCGVEIHHPKGKPVRYFKNCPTNEHEIQECAVIEKKYLKNMYKFCLNVYISPFKKLTSCPKFDKILTTTENPIKHSSTTNPPTVKFLPPTQGMFIPFKVVKFDATFNYSKSFIDVNWVVNRKERNSICGLNLILMPHNFNYKERVFSCENNSYKIQNMPHEAFEVCLKIFYQGSYAPLLCKSSEPFPYEFKASSMKDDGYKHSALIAVICLLILIVLIIIVILLKRILKKRTESDLYNVSAEEKNVLRRQASESFQREPCVRYSYTLKEQIEM